MRCRILLGGATWLLLAREAVANTVGGGGGRVPFTDFLIEVYNVSTSVWMPVALVVALLGCVLMIWKGHRITETIGKLALCVLLGGGGLAMLAGWAGGNVTLAWVW